VKTRTRIVGLLAVAYGLVAVVALFPGKAIGEAWARIGKPVASSLSGEKEGRFFGVLSELGARGVAVVTYGGCGDETRGSVFAETHLADYHLLPGPPIRAVVAPEPEAVPAGGWRFRCELGLDLPGFVRFIAPAMNRAPVSASSRSSVPAFQRSVAFLQD
jgi:hypothetical protein